MNITPIDESPAHSIPKDLNFKNHPDDIDDDSEPAESTVLDSMSELSAPALKTADPVPESKGDLKIKKLMDQLDSAYKIASGKPCSAEPKPIVNTTANEEPLPIENQNGDDGVQKEADRGNLGDQGIMDIAAEMKEMFLAKKRTTSWWIMMLTSERCQNRFLVYHWGVSLQHR